MRNALLISLDSPPSFWGYNYALDFKGKNATYNVSLVHKFPLSQICFR